MVPKLLAYTLTPLYIGIHGTTGVFSTRLSRGRRGLLSNVSRRRRDTVPKVLKEYIAYYEEMVEQRAQKPIVFDDW